MRRIALLVAAAIVLTPTSARADDLVAPDATPAVEPDATPEVTPEPTIEYPRVMPSPHLRLSTGDGVLSGPDGRLYTIPRNSHILISDEWDKLDRELIRTQESEIRLQAENDSLKKSQKDWKPGWTTLVIALGTGIAAGWYIHEKF